VPLSRRLFIIGGASAVALAACGGDDDDDDDAVSDQTTTSAVGGLAIVRVFAPEQAMGAALRLPIALADAEGGIRHDDVPASITFSYGPEGGTMSAPVQVARHDDGIPTPYFPLSLTLPTAGSWTLEVEAGGERASTSVVAVDATKLPAVPKVGDRLIPVATPTTADPAGVEPICTRDPACPFHDQTLESAMASGKSIAFIIATPQFCQTAICGPVLDLLVERAEEYADTIAFVHAEVYTDDTAKTTTSAVQAYGLTYEPVLFLAQPDGTIASRLDYTYDGVELDEALSKLVQ
jgi:hypothetical protein